VAWLVAGLGNPGERYSNNRHNVGAMVADLLASRAGERFRKVRFVPVEVAQMRVDGETVYLAKSHRWMNEAGPSYASLAKKRGVDVARFVAIHDDIDLAFGALKVKLSGSTAGHNGLKSLQSALGTAEFLRVRLGVGRPPGRQDPADFVLEPFAKRELPEVEVLIEEAADAVLSLIRDGLERTQDRFNRGDAR
jgi:PTH1 family peptidyl-tRNA hydrolase